MALAKSQPRPIKQKVNQLRWKTRSKTPGAFSGDARDGASSQPSKFERNAVVTIFDPKFTRVAFCFMASMADATSRKHPTGKLEQG
jgi:hypothetical protein